MKKVVREAQQNADNLKEFRENLQQIGFSVKIQYKGEFKPNQKKEIQDIWINKVGRSQTGQLKDGFFFKKHEGFSLSAIDYGFSNFEKEIIATAEKQIGLNHSNGSGSTTDTLQEIAGEVIEDFLKPNYVSQQEEEWWRKKRKSRR